MSIQTAVGSQLRANPHLLRPGVADAEVGRLPELLRRVTAYHDALDMAGLDIAALPDWAPFLTPTADPGAAPPPPPSSSTSSRPQRSSGLPPPPTVEIQTQSNRQRQTYRPPSLAAPTITPTQSSTSHSHPLTSTPTTEPVYAKPGRDPPYYLDDDIVPASGPVSIECNSSFGVRS